MKLLHVVPTWYPATRYGGTIVSTRALCAALARGGDAVEVLTTAVDGPGDLDVPLDRSVDDSGIAVRYCASPRWRRLYWSPGMRRLIREWTPRADLVHTHSVFLWPTLAAARAARASLRPYVVSPRGMLVGRLIAARSRVPKTLWIACFERTTLRDAAAIHVTSAIERDELLALDLGRLPRIEVIANGVDQPPASGQRSEADRILFLGRLSWKKGIDRLLAAMPGVPLAQLEIAGPDDEGLRPALEAQARSLGIGARVQFSGELDSVRRWHALARCSLLVLPSRSENFGNVVAEAMAAGRPVVVTPEVGAAAIVRAADAGLVASAEDGSLAAAISRLLAEPQEAAAMGRRGALFAQRELSWDSVAARMRGLYGELIAAAPRR